MLSLRGCCRRGGYGLEAMRGGMEGSLVCNKKQVPFQHADLWLLEDKRCGCEEMGDLDGIDRHNRLNPNLHAKENGVMSSD